eukprot:597062-Pyramimonas_sp.AAC.1
MVSKTAKMPPRWSRWPKTASKTAKVAPRQDVLQTAQEAPQTPQQGPMRISRIPQSLIVLELFNDFSVLACLGIRRS